MEKQVEKHNGDYLKSETKMYIDINEYAEGKAGVRLTAEPPAPSCGTRRARCSPLRWQVLPVI